MSGTGSVQSVAHSTTDDVLFGLGSDLSCDVGYAPIDFGIHISGDAGFCPGRLEILESGTWKYCTADHYAIGDRFAVSLEYDSGVGHNVVRYYWNGKPFYTNSSPT